MLRSARGGDLDSITVITVSLFTNIREKGDGNAIFWSLTWLIIGTIGTEVTCTCIISTYGMVWGILQSRRLNGNQTNSDYKSQMNPWLLTYHVHPQITIHWSDYEYVSLVQVLSNQRQKRLVSVAAFLSRKFLQKSRKFLQKGKYCSFQFISTLRQETVWMTNICSASIRINQNPSALININQNQSASINDNVLMSLSIN